MAVAWPCEEADTDAIPTVSPAHRDPTGAGAKAHLCRVGLSVHDCIDTTQSGFQIVSLTSDMGTYTYPSSLSVAASLELNATLASVCNKAMGLTQWAGNFPWKVPPPQATDSLWKAPLSAHPLAPVRPCPRQPGRAKKEKEREEIAINRQPLALGFVQEAIALALPSTWPPALCSLLAAS